LSVEPRWRGTLRPSTGQLLVSEVFGPTLQGEGPSAGQTAAFVRLGGCNLQCSWCDTGYTWDNARYNLSTELRRAFTEDVAEEVLRIGSRLVVLTGGEPTLQVVEALRLTQLLQAAGRRVEIETNGTVPIKGLSTAELVVVSPKLANAGMPERARLRWEVLRSLSTLPNVVFKFVIASSSDLIEADRVANRLSLQPGRVWVMPEAQERAVLLQRMTDLAGPVAERRWSLSGRLQVLLWDGERGR
jgi:7-carboxy-7-deazaguanine synthase